MCRKVVYPARTGELYCLPLRRHRRLDGGGREYRSSHPIPGLDTEPNALHRRTGDTELIVRAAEGDRKAFGALYERYVLKALEAIHRYEIRGVPFLSWLFRIAYNLTVSYRRARKNGTVRIPGLEVHGSLHTPEASCVARADGEWVWEAVRRLKGHQRQVIVMRFVDGLSYSEAARVLGRQVNAVRVIQHRALRALRRRLQDNLGQPLR